MISALKRKPSGGNGESKKREKMEGFGGQRWQVVDVSFGVFGEQWGG